MQTAPRFHLPTALIQVGDCQAAMCGAFGVEVLCTQHRPEEPSEAQRLLELGERVVNGRLHGLAVSRAFGDLDTKLLGRGIIATPQARASLTAPEHERGLSVGRRDEE